LIYSDLVETIVQEGDRGFGEKYLEASGYATVEEYYRILEDTVHTFNSSEYARKDNVRIWLFEGTGDDLTKLVTEQAKEGDDAVFEFRGEFVPKDQRTIGEAFQLKPKTIVIVEFKDAKRGWCIRHESVPAERRCENC
jgi:hypothetical protein